MTTMTDIVRPVSGCRVCGNDDWLDVISFGPMPLANNFQDPVTGGEAEPRYPLDVMVCRCCWLMSLRHVVDPQVLYQYYPYVSSDSLLVSQHMRHLARLCVRRFRLSTDALVVELGSNVGSQLEPFRSAGLRVYGIDPARNLAAIANRRGIPTLPEFFTAESAGGIAREHGPARLIMGRHVLAHIDNLDDVIDGVRALLDRDGVFVVEVPYLLDLLEGNQFDTIYHEHLSYFSLGALARLFGDRGMRVLGAERFGVHGGSIVVFAGRVDGRWPTHPTVTDLLPEEERAGLRGEARYHAFADRVQRTRRELGRLVRELVASGRPVAGYGAPAKGSTLLNACGLGRAELAYCLDTTPLKLGKVLPGSRVPVLSPALASQQVPDFYLLLAWNYADEIIRNERGFLENGGRFIVPVPEPLIVSRESSMAGLL
jgi:novobiocin biosynthesis protein NovU/D-mycarose 3-C-methyltransferase